MCFDEIGLCAQNINTISSLVVNTIMKVYVIILDSYDFASKFRFKSLKWQVAETLPKLIQQLEVNAELGVCTIGLLT